jgi:adenosylcobinamide-GDP ribazoletransferase
VESLKITLVFLTRLPVPLGAGAGIAALGRAGPWFPVVGALVGLAGGLAYAAAGLLGLPPTLAALLAVALAIALTGGLHEDGLADTADALGGRDREARLAILRDSRIGTFGALALLLVVGGRIAALAALAGTRAVLAGLVAAAALSRAVLPLAMRHGGRARTDGLAAAAGRPPAGHALAAAGLGIVVATLALPAPAALAAVLAAALAALAAFDLTRRAFGGMTGDTLGAIQQVTDAATLLALVAVR